MWQMCVHVHGLSASYTVDCSELCVVGLKLSWTSTHTSLPTPVLTNVCIVTPDTVGRITCVTVGETTWELGVGQPHYLMLQHWEKECVRMCGKS